MAMSGFFCQDAYLNKLSRLSDEEFGRVMRALMKYHASGEIVELGGFESLAFDVIRDDIDRDEKSYEEKCERNRQNRNGGTRPSTTENDRQQSTTTVNDRDQYNITKNNRDIEKETPLKGSKEKASRFSPPSVEEVKAYCTERNNGVDAQTFVDFYASKGWKVGNSPMKDWKACVRTWEQRDNTPRATPVKPTKTVVAQQYEQRDYSGVQAALTAEQDDYYARRIAEKKAKQAQENAEMEEWLRRESS